MKSFSAYKNQIFLINTLINLNFSHIYPPEIVHDGNIPICLLFVGFKCLYVS